MCRVERPAHFTKGSLMARKKQLPCWHVNASNGLTYGVSATTKVEAMHLLQLELRKRGYVDEETGETTAVPVKAAKVGNWQYDYGTIICYGDTAVCGGAVG